MQLHAVDDLPGQQPPMRLAVAATAAGRGLLSGFLYIFVAIGWIGGTAWLAVMSIDYGFRAGAGWPQRQPRQPAADEPPAES